MENAMVKETTEILKKLSPQNQSYFMTLVRLAATAENSAKNELHEKSAAESNQST